MTAVLRAAGPDDLDELFGLARREGRGVTSLPPNREHLATRLERSAASFARTPARPGPEEYLFVAESGTGQLVATSAIAARVGGYDPFYTYEVREERVTHAPLGVDRIHRVLHLKTEHKGPTELCGLLVDPAHRGSGLGRLASLGRLVFMATEPDRFASTTIAEIRGFQDGEGVSPFWEAVAKTFLAPRQFGEADMLTGLGEKDFVADLMPRHPIYADLLPPAVRQIIGEPHPAAMSALHLLHQEGFTPSREVDIFDAGPILECRTRAIRTVRSTRVRTVAAADLPGERTRVIVMTLDGSPRAVICHAAVTHDEVSFASSERAVLGVVAGDRAAVAALVPTR